jgi:mono/diheme cytochrome c family protein
MTASASHTAWAGPWGISFTANLTPDPDTGLGRWSEQDFIDTIRSGRHRGRGRRLLPPMPWFAYATMTDDDLRAIFAYLRTLKPVVNRVPQPIPPDGR